MGNGTMTLAVVAVLAGLSWAFAPEPPEPPFEPKQTLQERLIRHPVNRWKIRRAEKRRREGDDK